MNPRIGKSSQRGSGKFRPNTFFPARHKYSEIVPTGHSQLQNAFRSKNAIAKNAISRNIAAGCTCGIRPLKIQYLKFINPAIGNQPSTPAGRRKPSRIAPVSNCLTQK